MFFRKVVWEMITPSNSTLVKKEEKETIEKTRREQDCSPRFHPQGTIFI